LPPGDDEVVQQLLGRARLLLCHHRERLDSAPGHPAGSVPMVGFQLLDAIGQGGGHVPILAGPSFACK
jgi:hypothetical protein